MKYSAILVALAVGALARPQESASITSAPAASASLTPTQSCIASCAAGDVTCQAACVGVARPNSSQAAASNECAAKCDQGDGSPKATEAYAKCQQDCFASLFPSTQTAAPFAPGSGSTAGAASAGASATGSAGNAASTGGSASGTARASGSSTATGSASQASGTGAANANSVQMVGAGIAGLMAIFAL